MWKRFSAITICTGIMFSLIYMRIYSITANPKFLEVGLRQRNYNLNVAKSYGNIYDCNLKLLNNNTTKILAAINPTAQNVKDILPFIVNKSSFYKQVQSTLPFVCEVTSTDIPNSDIFVFEVPVRNTEKQLAPHTIGYMSDNKGVTGIELAFNDFLQSVATTISITFQADGKQQILEGAAKDMSAPPKMAAGVITTIDADIQRICEEAVVKTEMKKGAVVVMEPATGEIRAVVSMPNFSPTDVAASLNNEDAPLINRAFSAYNVGSVFKLVTAAAALEQGISPDFTYECVGYTFVQEQLFKCHKLTGHGVLDMCGATVESCNTYFIELSRQLSSENFLAKASALGFGRKNVLADKLVSSGGNLQSTVELYNPAEKANLAFGQGMLTATPLQVAAMTAAIANDGKLPAPKLILGTTMDGKYSPANDEMFYTNAISQEVTDILKKFMVETVKTEDSLGNPYNTTAGGKTSTAQTWHYNEDGKEIIHAWFTGYFPADISSKPQYVVTVLVEDGIGGNVSAAPIFKEISEKIAGMPPKT